MSNEHDRRLQSKSARLKTLRLNDKAEIEDFQATGTKAKALGALDD